MRQNCKFNTLFNASKKLALAILLMGMAGAPVLAEPVKQLPGVVALAEEYAPQGIDLIYYEKKQSALLFLGTRHTFDPKNFQVTAIEQFISNFKPTLILYEGGVAPLAETKEQAVSRYAEFGLVRFLAHRAHIHSETFEPLIDDEVREVLKKYSPVEAKLYYILRMVPQWLVEENKQPIDEKMNNLLKKGAFEKSLGHSFPPNTLPNNVTELEQVLATQLPLLKDWRKIDFMYSDVGLKNTFFHRVKGLSSAFRNQALETKMFAAIDKGARVVVVAGGSHLGGTMNNISKKFAQME